MVVKTLRYVVISPLKLWCDCPLCRAQFGAEFICPRNFPPVLIYTSGFKRFEPYPSTKKLFTFVYSWTQKKDLWTTLNPFLPFHDEPGFYVFISFSKKICCNEELALHVLEGFCTLFKRNLTGFSGAGVVTFVEGWICSCWRTFGGVLSGSKSCKVTSYKDNLFWEFLCVPGNWPLHSRNCKTVSTGGCSCWLCRFVHSHWLIDCYLQLMIFLNWLIVECLILLFFCQAQTSWYLSPIFSPQLLGNNSLTKNAFVRVLSGLDVWVLKHMWTLCLWLCSYSFTVRLFA